ncbi:hypothetical protein Trydic_g9776 [Trypoxylus dichotomus]
MSGVGVQKKLVAPDGGWGWAIAAAFGLYFFLVFSLLASFGLIYKNEFKRLGFTGTQSSLIISTNGGLCMLCGLINGSLLNKFGTRKVSICSAILIIVGLLTTAYATSFLHFMISYGVVTSIGMGMGVSSYSVALNTYFVRRRTKVTGYVTALYGVGTILFPQLVSLLLANFTIQDSMLIITAIFGNTLVSAILLQPVRWHMKVEEIAIKDQEASEITTLVDEKKKKNEELNPVCNDVGSIYASMTSLDFNSSVVNNNSIKNRQAEYKERTILKRISTIIVKTFDLSLLTDPIFTNILVGLSIDFFVEFTYLCFIPFILMEGSLTVEQTASFMSVYAIADILFRFFAPFIGSILGQPNRVMYIISLVLLVICRSFLVVLTNYVFLLFLAAAIGGFRGMRLVYWSLVIPEYTPTERLAAAFGLLFTLNGLCLFIGGPILGILRDISENYKSCIIVLNLITTTTITLWTIEMIHRKIKLRRVKQRRSIALYGIGASLFRDLQLSFQENFTSSDGSFIFIMIIGNLITAMTFLQPVIVSLKEISIKYSRDGEYLPLDKNEFDRNQTKSPKTCSVALFADMKFITILIGLSIAFFVEFAFQWMLPYFLMESNFSIEETATFLSICAVVEIWFRLLAPYIASFFNQQNYFMFIITVVILFAVRINIIKKWTNRFVQCGISEPKLSIENITAHVFQTKRISDIYKRQNALLSQDQIKEVTKMCKQRLKNMPIQYIIREWDFRDHTLEMKPPVFIPRPETEKLVDLVLMEISTNGTTEVLELCCGSGAISIALLKENPKLKITAIDKSKDACDLTRSNAQRHDVSHRIKVIQTNISEISPELFNKTYDVIVSNPPYVPSKDMLHLQPEILRYEDSDALDGGSDGLVLIKLILQKSSYLLNAGGKTFLEVDPSHPQLLRDFLRENNRFGLSVREVHKDIFEHDRFVIIKKI